MSLHRRNKSNKAVHLNQLPEENQGLIFKDPLQVPCHTPTVTAPPPKRKQIQQKPEEHQHLQHPPPGLTSSRPTSSRSLSAIRSSCPPLATVSNPARNTARCDSAVWVRILFGRRSGGSPGEVGFIIHWANHSKQPVEATERDCQHLAELFRSQKQFSFKNTCSQVAMHQIGNG